MPFSIWKRAIHERVIYLSSLAFKFNRKEVGHSIWKKLVYFLL